MSREAGESTRRRKRGSLSGVNGCLSAQSAARQLLLTGNHVPGLYACCAARENSIRRALSASAACAYGMAAALETYS